MFYKYTTKNSGLINFKIPLNIGSSHTILSDIDVTSIIGKDLGLRPYKKYFRDIKKENKIWTWIRDHIFYSIFFMGWTNLIPIYIFQVIIVLLLHNEIIMEDSLPSVFIFDRVIGVFYFFLLSLTVSNVVSNSRIALKSFVGSLQGTVSEISSIMLAVVTEKKTSVENTYKIQRFNPQTNNVEQIVELSLKEILLEMRHILVTYFYVLSKVGRENFQIHTDKLSTLPKILKNELLANTVVPTNGLYMSKLLQMYSARLDILYEDKGLGGSTQVITYGEVKTLAAAADDADFAVSDLNQPRELLDTLSVITWILLCYYAFAFFPDWNLLGTLIIIWAPNLLFNGSVSFARQYNNPYELSHKGRLIGVNIKERTHDTIRNFDQIFVHLIKVLESSKNTQ